MRSQDNQTYIDDYMTLSANDLQRWGLTDEGFDGKVNWCCSYIGSPNEVFLETLTCGKATGQSNVDLESTWVTHRDMSPQILRVSKVDGGAVKSGKWKWECQCGKTCSHLLSLNPGDLWKCRTCQGVKYRGKSKERNIFASNYVSTYRSLPRYRAVIIGNNEELEFSNQLANILEMDVDDFLRNFKCISLTDFFPDSDRTDKDKLAAQQLTLTLSGYKIICLGHEVARAFGLGAKQGWFSWSKKSGPLSSMRIAKFPSPNPVNKWWKVSNNKERASTWLKAVTNS